MKGKNIRHVRGRAAGKRGRMRRLTRPGSKKKTNKSPGVQPVLGWVKWGQREAAQRAENWTRSAGYGKREKKIAGPRLFRERGQKRVATGRKKGSGEEERVRVMPWRTVPVLLGKKKKAPGGSHDRDQKQKGPSLKGVTIPPKQKRKKKNRPGQKKHQKRKRKFQISPTQKTSDPES